MRALKSGARNPDILVWCHCSPIHEAIELHFSLKVFLLRPTKTCVFGLKMLFGIQATEAYLTATRKSAWHTT